MRRALKDSVGILLTVVVLCVCYTLLVTLLGQLFFNKQANGSLITNSKGQKVGSELLAHPFTAKKYLWGRNMILDTTSFKSTQGRVAYGTISNLSQTSTELRTQVKQRAAVIGALNNQKNVPAELVTTSGSGLDPEISPQAAAYQVERIARARSLSAKTVQKVISKYTSQKTGGILGAARVNVLQVNLALDKIKS
ncbi:MAG: K(+)-transporting ATPase subunit C [Liquorilactobacillus satsumensis]